MKHTFLIKTISLFLIVLSVLMLSACDRGMQEITLGEGDWDSNAFHSQVAKFIIENGYDTKVNVVVADTAIMIATLTSGDMDAALEIWSDNIPTYNQDIADGHYEQVAVNYADNEQGLYIPRYLQEEYPGLVTVEDLADYAHLFPDSEGSGKGVIYGGPEGWLATEFLHNKVELYGLDEHYVFRPIDSNATLSATLASAYRDEEPWVGYNWEPTWIMGIFDMVLLEDHPYDPDDFAIGRGAFPSVDVTVVVRSDFSEDFPDIYAFFQNYETSTELTNIALAYMQENDAEASETAIWFLETYEDIWSEWVPEDVYLKVMDALA